MFSLASSTNIASGGEPAVASAGSSSRSTTATSTGPSSERMVTATTDAGIWTPGAGRGGSGSNPAVDGSGRNSSVVGVDHGRVGRVAVGLPHRSPVEGLEALSTMLHVGEASEPDEVIWPVEIAELTDQLHADGLLRLDELPVEQLDQDVAAGSRSSYCRSSTMGQQPTIDRLTSWFRFVLRTFVAWSRSGAVQVIGR